MFSRTLPQSSTSPGSEFDHRTLKQGESVSMEKCREGCKEVSGKPLTCGSLGHRRQGGRIVNGTTSERSRHPWAVKVLHKDRPLCGASLVTAVFLLSAAHCFFGARNQDFTLELGSGDAWVTTRVEELFVRSDFVRRSYDNDIALVKMDKEVSFNLLVRPVCLPSMVVELEGMEGTVVGWGMLQQNGNVPDRLQEIRLPVIPQSTCRLMSRHRKNAITDNMFCAGFMDGGGDACQGDSGGPFMVNGEDNLMMTLVGIVRYRSSSSPSSPSPSLSVGESGVPGETIQGCTPACPSSCLGSRTFSVAMVRVSVRGGVGAGRGGRESCRLFNSR